MLTNCFEQTAFHGPVDRVSWLGMATGLFAATNPLHFEAYPMVRQMEGEIVAMTRARAGGAVDELLAKT